MKAKTIKIKTIDEGLNDFAKAFKKAQLGKAKRAGTKTFFSSLAAVRRALTPQRVRLLRHIKSDKPGSVYELAKSVGKDIKNVSEDLRYLSEVGIIELEDTRGSRSQRKPVLLSDHIRLELVI